MTTHPISTEPSEPAQLRAGRPDDTAAIVALIEQENHRPADPGQIARRLAGLPSVIAEQNGCVVAFLYCRRFSPDMVELSNMVVASTARRGGLGARMVSMIEPELRALGYRAAIFVNCRLHLGATDERVAASRAFWLHQGYRIVFSTHGSAVFTKFLDRADVGTLE
jgi:GNAT superfamily N-acetyltransferase